jgi:hypothetical protein
VAVLRLRPAPLAGTAAQAARRPGGEKRTMSGRRAWRRGAGAVTPCLLGAWLLVGGLPGTRAAAQEAEECLACHGDRDLTTERDGRTVSLYVS